MYLVRKSFKLLFFPLLLVFFYLLSLSFSSVASAQLTGCADNPPRWRFVRKIIGETSNIYELTLKNNCPSKREFDLNVTRLPTSPQHFTGWSWKFENGQLNTVKRRTIGSGATANAKLTVFKPTNASVPPGTYTPLTVKATLVGNASVNDSHELTYTAEDPCDRRQPTLIVEPENETGVGSPGETLEYRVRVENRDIGDCPNSTVDLSAIILNNDSNGWTATFDDNPLTNIAPGAISETTLHITPPQNAPNGPKTITVEIVRPNGAPQSVNTTYTVQGAAVTPTNTPIPTNTPTPTPPNVTFTPTPTPDPNVTPTPTPTPGLTFTPTPTPIVVIDGAIIVSFGLDGIGSTARFPTGGNLNPVHPNKNFTVRLFDTTGNQLKGIWENYSFDYNPTLRKFEQHLLLASDMPTGDYNVYVESTGYLRERLPGSVRIISGGATQVQHPAFNLYTGNINNSDISEQRIDIMDYLIFASCWIYSQDRSTCEENPNNQTLSDMNDDGIVDAFDYTLFLREYGNDGDQLP